MHEFPPLLRQLSAANVPYAPGLRWPIVEWRKLPHSHQGRHKGTIDSSRGNEGIPTSMATGDLCAIRLYCKDVISPWTRVKVNMRNDVHNDKQRELSLCSWSFYIFNHIQIYMLYVRLTRITAGSCGLTWKTYNSMAYFIWGKGPRKQNSWGQHGVHLGPVGPKWAPCWPHEPCYQGTSWQPNLP